MENMTLLCTSAAGLVEGIWEGEAVGMGLCNAADMYIYISEFDGSSYCLSYPLKREIDFGFDFDSFVRGGRGEAVCARETHASLMLGLILGRM